MKNKPIILVIMVLVLAIVAGCATDNVLQINTPVPDSQAGNPAPSGQINVPGFKIQITTPGLNPLMNTADAQNRIAGILAGIWHGIISPITLVLSFINPAIQMYEVHNDGSQYNLGFLIGVALVFLILGVFAGSRRRR